MSLLKDLIENRSWGCSKVYTENYVEHDEKRNNPFYEVNKVTIHPNLLETLR